MVVLGQVVNLSLSSSKNFQIRLGAYMLCVFGVPTYYFHIKKKQLLCYLTCSQATHRLLLLTSAAVVGETGHYCHCIRSGDASKRTLTRPLVCTPTTSTQRA